MSSGVEPSSIGSSDYSGMAILAQIETHMSEFHSAYITIHSRMCTASEPRTEPSYESYGRGKDVRVRLTRDYLVVFRLPLGTRASRGFTYVGEELPGERTS